MRLKVLGGSVWDVVAEVDADGCCPVEQQLESLSSNPKLEKMLMQIYGLWDRIPAEGPRALGSQFYHSVDPDRVLHEFVKGDLRLFCFEASGRVVVCSHAILKQTQKTTKLDQERIRVLRNRYLAAESANILRFLPRDENDE